MLFCSKCGKEVQVEVSFCPSCGFNLKEATKPTVSQEKMGYGQDIMIVTTPSMPGYRVKKVLGVVSGLSPRTRGMGGKFVAGIQSVFGGEVSAFTSELEKARIEALERAKENARRIGGNAIVGLDLETSEVFQGVVVISATGTAVIVEPE